MIGRAAGQALLALVVLAAAGCAGIGPAALRANRSSYNVVMQQTDGQEMLMNLVRLRYRDTPYFLQVASVSANLKLVTALNISSQFPHSGLNSVSGSGTVELDDSPTMTYTPLQGEKFVKQLLRPADPDILLLLTHSGWSIERAFRLLVQEVNGIPNAPTAAGPTPVDAPRFDEFLRVAHLLRHLQQTEMIEVSREMVQSDNGKDAGAPRTLVRLKPEAMNLPETQELVRLLALTPGLDRYELVSHGGPRNPNEINIVTRSVMATMFYASQGVEVPTGDEADGLVTVTRDHGGQRFVWNRLLGDVIRIRSDAPARPPYVSVDYRGHRFFIDDSDLASKSSFVMLNTVLALQAGEIPSGGPVLTLPVVR